MPVTIFLPPHVPLRPWNMAHVARRLEAAIESLRGVDLRIPEGSRLPEAVAVLRECARDESYPEDKEARLRITAAISTAYEMVQVTDYLPESLGDSLREDLRRAVKGTLVARDPGPDRQIQSQLHVGAILAASGLRVGVPDPQATTIPDFVVNVGDLEIPLEVKRPSSVQGLLDSVDKAVAQMQGYSQGRGSYALFIDLSDVVCDGRSDSWEVSVSKDQGFGAAATAASDRIHGKAHERRGHERMLLLVAIAKAARWQGAPDPSPEFRFESFFEVLEKACMGLLDRQAQQLRMAIVSGLRELGADFRGATRV